MAFRSSGIKLLTNSDSSIYISIKCGGSGEVEGVRELRILHYDGFLVPLGAIHVEVFTDRKKGAMGMFMRGGGSQGACKCLWRNSYRHFTLSENDYEDKRWGKRMNLV